MFRLWGQLEVDIVMEDMKTKIKSYQILNKAEIKKLIH